MIAQAFEHYLVKCGALRQIRQTGPARIGKRETAEVSFASIAWQYMKMYVWIHHHEHEVVDLVVGEGLMQRQLDIAHGEIKLGKSIPTNRGKSGFGAATDKYKGAKRRLLGAQKNRPMAVLGDGAGRVAELSHGLVDGKGHGRVIPVSDPAEHAIRPEARSSNPAARRRRDEGREPSG